MENKHGFPRKLGWFYGGIGVFAVFYVSLVESMRNRPSFWLIATVKDWGLARQS